jgi:nicotinamide-nucleotide amidase
MQAELITIGDEILIGQTIDTNSAWMGQKLNEVGVEVHRIHSIRDTSEAIVQTLDGLHADTQLVLITGGLGPTKDDLTKHTLTRYFGGELQFDQEVFAHIKSLFQQMGRDISHLNRDQAELPSNALIWKNDVGTASAMRFEHEGRFFISMPGVPYEMKHLMHTAVLPWIAENFLQQDIVHRTFLTQGIPESVLAEQIREWELGLPKSLKLAYLPSPGIVKLRLSGMGERAALEHSIEEEHQKLRKFIGTEIFGEGRDSLQEVVGRSLIKKGWSLSTAESCTGGYIAHLLTTVSGSSAYFKGGAVAYANEVKVRELGVPQAAIETHGAVSEEVVRAMAVGGCSRFDTEICVSVSGVAGPTGGTEEKPVGTVWIGIHGPSGTWAECFRMGMHRERNIRRSGLTALNLLRKYLEAQ